MEQIFGQEQMGRRRIFKVSGVLSIGKVVVALTNLVRNLGLLPATNKAYID